MVLDILHKVIDPNICGLVGLLSYGQKEFIFQGSRLPRGNRLLMMSVHNGSLHQPGGEAHNLGTEFRSIGDFVPPVARPSPPLTKKQERKLKSDIDRALNKMW